MCSMSGDPMNIGVLGSGIVGQTLAQGFVKHGHSVMVGTNSKVDELKSKGFNAGTFADAASFGEIIVLAVKGTHAKDALTSANAEHLKNKVVIDVTNPIADAPPANGVLKFFTSLDNSLMEQLQHAFPTVRFVKAFNSIGNAFMVNPDFNGVKPTMFFCGNDAGAKKEVAKILEQFGFEPADMGGAEAARAIEPLCMLWCIPGFLRNEWGHAFKLLKK